MAITAGVKAETVLRWLLEIPEENAGVYLT